MSLNWEWNDKIGEVKQNCYGKEYTFNIYKGNAFMIAIHEYEEEGNSFYNLQWFFVDKEHCKRCLGLTKGYEKINYEWIEFNLNTEYKETSEFINLLAKAKIDVKINLYNKKKGSS